MNITDRTTASDEEFRARLESFERGTPPTADPLAVLDQLDEAHAKATPGPWFAWNRGVGWHLAIEDPTGVDHLPGRPELVPEGTRTDLARAEDAALIVAAVNALPDLVQRARRLHALESAALALADEMDEHPAIALSAWAVADRIRSTVTAALAAS